MFVNKGECERKLCHHIQIIESSKCNKHSREVKNMSQVFLHLSFISSWTPTFKRTFIIFQRNITIYKITELLLSWKIIFLSSFACRSFVSGGNRKAVHIKLNHIFPFGSLITKMGEWYSVWGFGIILFLTQVELAAQVCHSRHHTHVSVLLLDVMQLLWPLNSTNLSETKTCCTLS